MIIQHLRKTERITEKNYKQVKRIVISVGLLTLSLGLVLNRFFPGYPGIDFISGFFIGISIVANIVALLSFVPEKK